MKTDSVYKRAFNDGLDLLAALEAGGSLPTENELAARLEVSRTTVRKVLEAFTARGLISSGLPRLKLRSPTADSERYPEAETIQISRQVERQFMSWILKDDPKPGTLINERELARRFGVATTILREFLNRFQSFGIIEKRRTSGFVFRGVTKDFALELFEVRELYELRSAEAFAGLASESPLWTQLSALRTRHVDLLADIDTRYHDFSALDSQFHRLVASAAPNRFVNSLYDVITLVFHYHYQWKKHDERQRNEIAAREHLDYIDALFSRDPAAIRSACRKHLDSARETLLRSTSI